MYEDHPAGDREPESEKRPEETMSPKRQPWPARHVSGETMSPPKRRPRSRLPTTTAVSKRARPSKARERIPVPPRTMAAVAVSLHESFNSSIRCAFCILRHFLRDLSIREGGLRCRHQQMQVFRDERRLIENDPPLALPCPRSGHSPHAIFHRPLRAAKNFPQTMRHEDEAGPRRSTGVPDFATRLPGGTFRRRESGQRASSVTDSM